MEDYVIVTAARNEEKFIADTILSMVAQTVRPIRWVIVSDGSTDATDEIVGRFAKDHDFITLLSNNGDASRNFGSQVRAINAGIEKLKHLSYGFIGNLDADITLDADYYQTMLKRFGGNERLGVAGGYVCEKVKGEFQSRKYNRPHQVPHAIQLFRRACFEEIGGYIALPYGGPDWVAEVTARMNGWEVRAFPELRVYHHRMTISAEGMIRGGFRQGLMDYTVGSHPLFEILKCASRITLKPYLIHALSRMAGFAAGYCRAEKRYVTQPFISYLRQEQLRRLHLQ